MRQSSEKRKGKTDNTFLGCLRSPKADHYSDMEEDSINWGHTSGTSSLYSVIFVADLPTGGEKKLRQVSPFFHQRLSSGVGKLGSFHQIMLVFTLNM